MSSALESIQALSSDTRPQIVLTSAVADVPQADNSIHIQGVSKTYRAVDGRQVPALDNINLDIKSNEFVCLIGKSGCGKTTLLNMIAGFVLPSSGSIRVGNEVVTAPGKGKGVVFQQFGLFPWLTARKNIEFACKQRGMDTSERRRVTQEHIDLVGLRGFEDKYPYELSGGMQQRVAIARTLALDPKVLLMDEPFGALDELTRESLQKEVLQIWATRKKTVVFVTHSLSEAIMLADRVVVLKPNPGRFKAEYYVNLPRPRNATDPELLKFEREIQDALQ